MVARIFAAGLLHARDLVLALHDSLHHHHRGRRGAALESCLHVLGEGLFVFPLILVYTAISYSVFRGKVWSASGNY